MTCLFGLICTGQHRFSCGMNTLHGTLTAVYQSASDKSPTTSLYIDWSSRSQALDNAVPWEILSCDKPVPTKKKCVCTLNSCKSITNSDKEKDMAWVIGCLDFTESEVEVKGSSSSPGTWSAFNSMLSSSCSKINIALVSPLIRLPPTGYDALFAGLMRARAAATHATGPEAIIVLTFDFSCTTWPRSCGWSVRTLKNNFCFTQVSCTSCSVLRALGK